MCIKPEFAVPVSVLLSSITTRVIPHFPKKRAVRNSLKAQSWISRYAAGQEPHQQGAGFRHTKFIQVLRSGHLRGLDLIAALTPPPEHSSGLWSHYQT